MLLLVVAPQVKLAASSKNIVTLAPCFCGDTQSVFEPTMSGFELAMSGGDTQSAFEPATILSKPGLLKVFDHIERAHKALRLDDQSIAA